MVSTMLQVPKSWTDSGCEIISSEFVPCEVCGRTFHPERISRHQAVCKKASVLRRPVLKGSSESEISCAKVTNIRHLLAADHIESSSSVMLATPDASARDAASPAGSYTDFSVTVMPPQSTRSGRSRAAFTRSGDPFSELCGSSAVRASVGCSDRQVPGPTGRTRLVVSSKRLAPSGTPSSVAWSDIASVGGKSQATPATSAGQLSVVISPVVESTASGSPAEPVRCLFGDEEDAGRNGASPTLESTLQQNEYLRLIYSDALEEIAIVREEAAAALGSKQRTIDDLQRRNADLERRWDLMTTSRDVSVTAASAAASEASEPAAATPSLAAILGGA